MGPLDMSGPAPTGMMANPVLSELDNLSPQAKGALHQAHQTVMQQAAIQPVGAGAPGTQVPGTQPSQGPPASMSMPSPMTPQAQHMQMPTQVDSDLQTDKAELDRLNHTGSGIDQIKNPVGRTFAHIAEGIGTAFAPGLTAAIPGTQLHHNALVNQSENAVHGDEQLQNQQVGAAHQTAVTNTELDKPELNEAKAELGVSKLGEQHYKDAANIEHQKATEENGLRAHGFVKDPDGSVRPARYDEMDEKNKAITDLNGAREEMANASKDYKKAQTANIPQQMQLAQQRISNAQRSAHNAETALGLRQAEYNMHAFGTDAKGGALPGAMLDDEGKTVGSVQAANIRPTAAQRTKGDLAQSVNLQVKTMRDLLDKKPGMFGPGNGRMTGLQLAIGNNDPDALKFKAASDFLAEHAAGMFGSRSSQVIKDLQQLNSPHFNPQALKSSLDQFSNTAGEFQKAGTVHTVGSHPNPLPPASGGAQHTIDINGKRYKYKGSGPTESMSSYDEVKK